MSGVFLHPDDLDGWVVATTAMVEQAIEDIEAQARGAAPCLFGAEFLGDEGQVRAILRMAVVGLIQSRGGRLASTAAGPYQATFRGDGGGLTASDIERLRALCDSGQTAKPTGLPRAEFPSGWSYEHLFGHPTAISQDQR